VLRTKRWRPTAAMAKRRWRPSSSPSGVKHVAIPRKGRPGAQRQAVESSRRFRKLVKWRTGSEGRISHLKHSTGWERTMLDGIDGVSAWCGWGVLAHNATKISVLIEVRETTPASAGAAPTRRATANGTTRSTPATHQDSRRLDLVPSSPVAAPEARNGLKMGAKTTGEVGAGPLVGPRRRLRPKGDYA